jgi:predicted metalloprotease with PDZ domain
MILSRRRALLSLLSLSCFATIAAAQGLDPIRYTVGFPASSTHYAKIEATIPTARKPEIDLMMAVWTPGSYLVREYERNIEGLSARTADGKPLALKKTLKNHWTVTTGGAASVIVAYRLYCHEMSVRTNWVESRYGFLTGAATFITLSERAKRPHEVRLTLPAEWKTSMTGLPAVTSGGAIEPHAYRADDFDTLVDSPILAGNPAVYEFEVEGKKHYLVNDGEAGVWDGPRSARDAEKIVREAAKLWGSLPYEKYVFFNMLTESGGGLEHRNSVSLMASRWATSTHARYQGWLKLVSHEFFHAWNVKRLRPVELGPFDYDHEVYTTGLWVAEGITDYYADLLVRRAGLSDDAEYLQDVSGNIRTLQTTPGRLVQPVETASYDTWVRQYRPDENSPNVSISYYTKGAVLGFLIDAKVRKATAGAKSLDDVMRLAFQRFSGPKGYTAPQFRATVDEVAGTPLGDWWHTALETTTELEYAEALDWFGLRFKPVPVPEAGAAGVGVAGAGAERATLGLVTRIDGGRLLVSQVRRDTPGYAAGVNVDDEIVAIGDFRVRADQWVASMERYRPGQTVSLLVARRDQLMRLDATFGRDAADQWRLEPRPEITADQQQHTRAWMGAQ